MNNSNIKTIKFIDANNEAHFIRPKRPLPFDNDVRLGEAKESQKDYSNDDTPFGKKAVVYQACKLLRRSGVDLGFEFPQYTIEQRKTMTMDEMRIGNICPEISDFILSKFEFLESTTNAV